MGSVVQRQIERDNLDELIVAAEAEHGSVTDEEITAKREELARARDVQHDAGSV